MTPQDPDLAAILLELQPQEPLFHRPSVASTQEEFANLMAPGYWEVGASGRRYHRDFILTHLALHAPVDAAEAGWVTSDFALLRLGLDTFLLTYALDQAGRLSHRATVWRRSPRGWQILYHQGTLRTDLGDHTDPGSGYTPRPGA